MSSSGAQGGRWMLPCPEHVVIIGGGRWARVLAGVVCELVSPSVRISVHSPHNTEAMSAWTARQGWEKRIEVTSGWPQLRGGPSSAVIVANAARDHELAAERALTTGAAVLVEKPMTLTADASYRLAALARSQSVRLAAAHVLLFTRYLDNLHKRVAEAGEVRFLRVRWMDPEQESRWGEHKRYDPGLPVYADCLPHVLSMIGSLAPGRLPKCERARVLRGGAQVELELLWGDIPCSVELARNADRRKRVVEVVTEETMLRLDFSTEPGTITVGTAVVDADPDWEVARRPVARMLTAFLQWAAGGEFDERLDVEIGLRASQVIDQASALYRSALMPWLVEALASPGRVNDDVRYALSELLQCETPFPEAEIEQQIERVHQRIIQPTNSRWTRELAEAPDPARILRAMAT